MSFALFSMLWFNRVYHPIVFKFMVLTDIFYIRVLNIGADAKFSVQSAASGVEGVGTLIPEEEEEWGNSPIDGEHDFYNKHLLG